MNFVATMPASKVLGDWGCLYSQWEGASLWIGGLVDGTTNMSMSSIKIFFLALSDCLFIKKFWDTYFLNYLQYSLSCEIWGTFLQPVLGPTLSGFNRVFLFAWTQTGLNIPLFL